MGLIEAIDQGAVLDVGTAFLGAPAHAEITVSQRHDGFQLGEEFGTKPFLDDVPLVGRVIMGWRSEAFVMDHRAVPPMTAVGYWSVNQFAQIVYDQMRAMVLKLLGVPFARHADH